MSQLVELKYSSFFISIMQDLTPYMPVIVPAVTFGLGWLAKHGQTVVAKIHAFRDVVDKVDNMMRDSTATDQQINSVIASAQLL